MHKMRNPTYNLMWSQNYSSHQRKLDEIRRQKEMIKRQPSVVEYSNHWDHQQKPLANQRKSQKVMESSKEILLRDSVKMIEKLKLTHSNSLAMNLIHNYHDQIQFGGGENTNESDPTTQ